MDYKSTAISMGAELLTGLGQFRAGHGRHVTDWCNTEAEAWAEFCQLALHIESAEARHHCSRYAAP